MTIVTNEIVIDDDFQKALTLAQKYYYEGGVFVYPTDTIYGFGANPFNGEAVERISVIKNRHENKRFIFLVDSIETLLRYVSVAEDFHVDFLLSIWPNPISVVLNLKPEPRKILRTSTAAFRIPHHTFCQKFLEQIKMPLISTSVNRGGEQELNDPAMILQEFRGEVEAVFFSKKRQMSKSSTVISLVNNKFELIRDGRIRFCELAEKFNSMRNKLVSG